MALLVGSGTNVRQRVAEETVSHEQALSQVEAQPLIQINDRPGVTGIRMGWLAAAVGVGLSMWAGFFYIVYQVLHWLF